MGLPLDEEKQGAIKKALRSQKSLRTVAREEGVAVSTVHRIKHEMLWAGTWPEEGREPIAQIPPSDKGGSREGDPVVEWLHQIRGEVMARHKALADRVLTLQAELAAIPTEQAHWMDMADAVDRVMRLREEGITPEIPA